MGCDDAPCESRGCSYDYGHGGRHSWDSDSRPLSAPLPDFDKLFRDLDSTVATSVRGACFEGVRLGIGYAVSCIEAAHATAVAHGASADTEAWLALLAVTLREASVSDELARALDQ